MAGRVESVGKNVKRFQPTDEVLGDVFKSGLGAFAEYVCATENAFVLKPASTSFEEAAAVPVAALTALQGIRDKGQVQAGQRVLINGASGDVGTFAVQIAKSFGAEVTGVCSTRNVEMVRSIGADHVVDYTKEDFTQKEVRYDIFLDTVGTRSLSDCRRVLTENGIYVGIGGPKTSLRLLGRMVAMLATSMFGSRKMVSMLASQTKEDLVVLSDLLESGEMIPVIDRTYPLDETPEALRYLGEGHVRGKLVISI